MTFGEKITFLLNITNTSNVEMANALGIKPSIISLYKNDKRGVPKKKATVERFSDFFSSKMRDDYQFRALNEIVNTEFPINGYTVRSILTEWLYGERVSKEDSLRNIVGSISLGIDEENETEPPIFTTDRSPGLMSGREGKIESAIVFLSHALTVKNPKRLYIHCDTSEGLLHTEPEANARLLQALSVLVKRGCEIYHFLPPSTSDNMLPEFFMYIPLYCTGKVHPYYYPRFRDSTFRNAIFLLEDEIVLFSHEIYRGSSNGYAVTSQNKELLKHNKDILEDYKKICKPAITILQDRDSALAKYVSTFDSTVAQTSIRSTLPIELAPPEVIEIVRKYCTNGYIPPEWFPKNVFDQEVLDICQIATARDVKDGKVHICPPGMPYENSPVYTPELYAKHLECILEAMLKYPEYNFIPSQSPSEIDTIIVRHGLCAHISSRSIAPKVFEIISPDLVLVVEEYIRQKADAITTNQDYRKIAIRKIKNLIEDLKK